MTARVKKSKKSSASSSSSSAATTTPSSQPTEIPASVSTDSSSQAGAESGNVRVVSRIRPMANYELENGSKQVVHSMPTLMELSPIDAEDENEHGPKKQREITLNTEPEVLEVRPDNADKRWFELDAVFDHKSSQQEVYIKSGAQHAVCVNLFKGFNCTILAYGQTGAGKTFTMGTAAGSTVGEFDGVIPRACVDLFQSIREKCDGNAQVTLSYLEIYNEEIRDLMTDKQVDQKELRIRETLNGEVYVSGIQTKPVTSPKEIGKLMEEASKRRVVASTKMNAVSSRSHAICVLRITGVLEDATKFQSKLTLVDLAGSERIKKTGAQGNRRAEGISINKGLFVLGQVVSALAEKRSKMKRKPPYRDSKLTRLLQDSLGGNSRTIMIACVSPADFNLDETINTLRYATSARNIKNTATQNVIQAISPEEAAKLQRENQLLKKQVDDLQDTIKRMQLEQEHASGSSSSSDDSDDPDLENEFSPPPPQTKKQPTRDLLQRVDDANKKKPSSKRILTDGSLHRHLDAGRKSSGVEDFGMVDDFGVPIGGTSYDDDQSVSIIPDDVTIGTVQTTPSMVGKTPEQKRIRALEKEIKKLRSQVGKAQGEIRRSLQDSAVEFPAMKAHVAVLEEELQVTHELEEENAMLKQELEEVRMDAQSARMAANQLSTLIEQLKAIKNDEMQKKRIRYDHVKVEETWVSFICQILQSNKESMKKLRDDFHLVVRVVESPEILTPLQKNRKRWWGGGKDQDLGHPDMNMDPEMRQELLASHVQFFVDKMMEMENGITSESDSLSFIRDSLRKELRKLENGIGQAQFVRDSLNKDDDNLLKKLSSLLIGPVRNLDDA